MTVLDTAGAYAMQVIRAASEEAQAKLQAAGVRKPDAVFGSNIDSPNISLVWQDGASRTELVFDGSDQPQLIEVGTGPWDERIGNVRAYETDCGLVGLEAAVSQQRINKGAS